MLGRLNHVAIAVKDAEKAARIYGGAFGAEISGAVPLPEHGVITVFVTLPNTKIEFIQPLGEASPIAKFVERNADGGIHHICYDVPDIIAARDKLIWSTLISAVVFGIGMWAYHQGYLNIERLSKLMGLPF